MKVSMKSLFLAGTAVALFGASATAQSQSGKVFARYNKPLKSVNLDMDTGTITYGPAVNDRAAGTIADFSNIDLGGFVGVDTGNCFCEWFDAGLKGVGANQPGNASNMISNIVFAYCSSKAGVASGGPGGTVKLGFYEGYALGGGAPTTACAVFTLTGLPAHTASSSFFGGFTCYFINVTFGTMVCCNDGLLGYSWKFLDAGADGVLAGTWPFLSCVQSCSGTGIDGQGMRDFIDQYCPPGSLRATFTFGTTPFGGYFTSMSMDVREAADLTATTTNFNGNGTNADTLGASAAVLGQNWSTAVAIGHAHGASGAFSLRVRTMSVNGPTITSPIGGRQTQVLSAGTLLITLAGSHNGATGGTPPVAIPKSLGLCATVWSAQGTVVGGGFADLTSEVHGISGTQ